MRGPRDENGSGALCAGSQELVALSLAELERLARRACGGSGLPLREWNALAETWRIAQALHQAHGNRSAAARALGIGRRTLYAKLERLGLATHQEGSARFLSSLDPTYSHEPERWKQP